MKLGAAGRKSEGAVLWFAGIRRLEASKRAIMAGLLLLLVLFVTALWILSTLNLKYSQQAMAQLRHQQIDDGFRASLEQINTEHRRLEAYADELAQQAALFHRLHHQGGMNQQVLGQELLLRLQRYDDVFASGIWFWPDVINPRTPFAALAYRDAEGPKLFAATDQPWQDYRRQIWFPLALGPDWQADRIQPGDHYWTPAYYNPLTDAAVISLIRPVVSAGEIVGVVSVDWHADTIIEYVSRIRMTPGTFAWLIDRNGRRLSSLSQLEDKLMAEQLMAAVEQALQAEQEAQVEEKKQTLIQVDERRFELFHAHMQGGLVFGVGVPLDEIQSVLEPMRSTNRTILLSGSLIILLLCLLMLGKIAALVRELQASYTDELTGLGNRARLLQVLQSRRQASLVILDIDRFRELNALFGHGGGDYILRTLATRLQQWLEDEQLSAHSSIYRLGADRFVWLGPEQSPQALALRLQQLALLLQSHPLHWGGHEFHIGVTLGATSTEGAAEPVNLVSEAQDALKQARQQGLCQQLHDRNRSLEQQFGQNLFWANRLREALRTDRLEPWFQPIMTLSTGQVEKYECLLRMRDHEGEVIAPGHFLDVARQLRLDRQITRLMVTKSCRHFAGTGLQFSLNLSWGDLRDEDLIAFILDQLDHTGVGPQLIFEILESDGIDNYAQVRHFIERVKKRGCRVAIDDFGTGYSNFEHLLRLDVDLIKIDGSLIRHLHTDAGSRRVVRGIVSFAHSLQIQTVAEFVHSDEVLAQVQALGIDFAQGQVIGMPGPETLD